MIFPTRSGTRLAVQPQNMATGLKFWILEDDLHSENKGADQLCGYLLLVQVFSDILVFFLYFDIYTN